MTAKLPSTKFALNGEAVEVQVDPQTPLLYVLRNDLEQTGTRYGCGLEQCGACTVLLDGEPAYACTLPLAAVAERKVTTVEGLDAPGQFPELVKAFETLQAAQCGYCVSGILIRAAALLHKNPSPDEAAVKAALDPSLCRCGTQQRMVEAVLAAAEARHG
jgi:nicotinate dehydrogenase subunit A